MGRILVSLVGEQPAPNILPLGHFAPDHVILIHTKRTEALAGRIAALIGSKVIEPFCKTDAYRLDQIRSSLETYLEKHAPSDSELIFNLTGGTKTMGYAAMDLARQRAARAFYYQTEDNQSLIHPYRFEAGNMLCEAIIPIQAALTLDQHLRLYINSYTLGKFKNDFERNVFAVVQSLGDDYEAYSNVELTGISGNVEVDWAIRYQNTIAVGEVKLHAKKTDGIDQLNGVTDQRTLGTYTRKFLVSADAMHINDLDLAEAYRITTVILPSGRQPELTSEDIQKLSRTIRLAMEPRK